MDDDIQHEVKGPKGVFFIARDGLEILPLCPFARSVFDKTPAYADVRRS